MVELELGGPTSGRGAKLCSAADFREETVSGVAFTEASASPEPPMESGDSRRLVSLTRLCMDIVVADLDGPALGEDGGESGRGVDVGDKGCHTTSTLVACTCLDFVGA